MSDSECIVGIDLGTTNSEVAAYVDDKVLVIGDGTREMLPSCVGITPEGELLVGEAARNQFLLYPERTIRSVKRRMGTDDVIELGDKTFSPQEISALILRELANWARATTGKPVSKAVITVPAYFSDAQRQATREAGAMAGLEVIRILNEPTAASLAYGFGDGNSQTVMVYDLGGGTFDVSIVRIEGDVTSVLASHGNNKLGGDDFDERIVEYFIDWFEKEHGEDLRKTPQTVTSRLWWAAEEAKRKLSEEQYVAVREEALIMRDGIPLHLDLELSRHEYEQMIIPLLETTMESVSKALNDADTKPADLDAVLLVGGATRTPLVTEMIEDRLGIKPRGEVHPDLCVALGAGVLASRQAGHEIERVLVDIVPYSFGISFRGMHKGDLYDYCYKPIIHRNTPVPISRTESYVTAIPYQDNAQIMVFQGDSPDALQNIPVGEFVIEGLTPTYEHNTVLCKMQIDLNGILHVTAIEKQTGMSKHVRFEGAIKPRSDEQIAEARKRLAELMNEQEVFGGATMAPPEEMPLKNEIIDLAGTSVEFESLGEGRIIDSGVAFMRKEAESLLEKSRGLLESMHEEDQEDAIGCHEQIQAALADEDADALKQAVDDLKELLFFVEGR